MTANGKNHCIVLITGASAGIGRELALEFGARTETLVLIARRQDRVERLREDILVCYPELKVVALFDRSSWAPAMVTTPLVVRSIKSRSKS
jgi:NADP-dependent 3-hydroxy acid dehydrogenase YdfG